MLVAMFTASLVLLSTLPSSSSATCSPDEEALTRAAFSSVSGFDSSDHHRSCSADHRIEHIDLHSKNLSGTISWAHLAKLTHLRTLDLSGNSLQGSVPAPFWSLPALLRVNLAGNCLGGTVGGVPSSPLRALNLSWNRLTGNSLLLSGFREMRVLDLSGNDLRELPEGIGEARHLRHLDLSGCRIAGAARVLSGLRHLNYLDLSDNAMEGNFPGDFPPIQGLRFLNISSNNFSGLVASEKMVERFGRSAFVRSGVVAAAATNATRSKTRREVKKKKVARSKRQRAVIVAGASAVAGVVGGGVLGVWLWKKGRRKGREKGGEEEERGEQERGRVAEAREARGAKVVMFEKPLMSLTYGDLVAATSQFGRESQLAEGGRGRVYRAVLAWEMHVAIKVMERGGELGDEDTVAMLQGLSRFKHPNLLTLLGYCIAGREKLLLYEFMVNGDLRQWLHELPTGKPNVEDWSGDKWEEHHNDGAGWSEAGCWPTRHRIAVGVARGLAYLHHGGSKPMVHGHLVPTNILLDDNFEPRISDYDVSSSGEGSQEADVYAFGVVLLELLTGKVGSEEMVARVRERLGAESLDPRLVRVGGDECVGQIVECMRVGYLCTAKSPQKRPTMQQVVGLLKDIRPDPCMT